MPFAVKSFEQIYNDLVAHVRYASKDSITDFNVGSVVRSLLEAAALNDAELYLQLSQLKELNNLNLLFGDDLDERAAEYGLTRLPATPSLARAKFVLPDVTKISSTLATAITAGSGITSIVLTDASAFPVSGFVIIERGTSKRERVRYTSKSGNTLTVPAANAWTSFLTGVVTDDPSYGHSTASSVILSNVGADVTFNAGTFLTAPATGLRGYDVRFSTNLGVKFLDGDVETAEVTATSLSTGISQNVAAGEITVIDNPPGNGSQFTVVSSLPATTGNEIETDVRLRSRIVSTIQGRLGGTGIAIENAALNVTAVVDGGSVTCRLSRLVESLDGSTPSVLYVHDGNATAALSGFASSVEFKGYNNPNAPLVLIKNAKAGQRRARINNWPLLNKPTLFKTAYDATANNRGYGTNGVGSGTTLTDSTKTWTNDVFVGKYLVDSNGFAAKISSNTNTVINVEVATSSGLGSGPYGIIDVANPVPEGQVSCNLASGDIELVSGAALTDNEWLVCWSDPTDSSAVAYTYYTGLVAEVQRVISGDNTDPVNYPGYAALGSIVRVAVPTVVTQATVVSITPVLGVQETTELQDLVKAAIQAYVSSLNIGEPFILSEAIARCQQVPGVFDTLFINPTQNVNVLPNELFRVDGDIVVQ